MDDDRFTELMGFFGTHLSRATYALETIASAHIAMAEMEIKRHSRTYDPPITLRPVRCQQPCCREET